MKRFLMLPTVLALVIMLCAFPSCATGPQNAGQAALTLRTDYNLALQAADAYGQLPFCDPVGAPTVKICADKAIVIKIDQAKNVAKPAIDAAEAVVRTPGYNSSAANEVLIAGQAALNALVEITNAISAMVNVQPVKVP